MIGAVVSGGIFGDHISPISDTTIISSMASGCDHIEHVRTQIPYALITALLTSILYLIVGWTVI
jgi:Na+/H+ antiporter NhaC